jgi:hypothetical protein
MAKVIDQPHLLGEPETAGTVPEKTETEKAHQLFLERVRSMAGVIHADAYGGQTLGEQSIRVHVRRDDQETEYAVYDLKAEVYQQYPDACLRVDVWLEDAPEAASAPAPKPAAV